MNGVFTSAPPSWPDAACASEDPRLFFPEVTKERESLRDARRQARVAASVCFVCPRQDECRLWAYVNKPSDGVWGGVWLSNGAVLPLGEGRMRASSA